MTMLRSTMKENILTSWVFPGVPVVRNLPANAGSKGSVPNPERSYILQSLLSKAQESAKETISKVKRQPSDWEKIIASEATDKGLISKIYKHLLQHNSRKINDPIKK